MTTRDDLGRRERIAQASLAIAALAAALASVVLVPGLLGLLGAGLALLMAAIAAHDARHFAIPNVLNAAAFALALAHAAVLEPSMIWSAIGMALVRAGATGGMFLAIKLGYRWWRRRDGLGMGDVKLAAVAGAWLDWLTIPLAVEIAVAAALGAYVINRYLRRRPLRATSVLPFGLYLAPAIWAAWLIEAMLFAP